MKHFLVLIFFGLLIFASAIIVAYSLKAVQEEAKTPLIKQVDDEYKILPYESGVFERASFAEEYAQLPLEIRNEITLKEYYRNKAFHGAPPTIPHPILDPKTMGGKGCLQCHQNGGFVAEFKTFAPITPHPEMVNCRQCHVGVQTDGLFKESTYKKLKAPPLGNVSTVSSPPVVPHQLQMHENCLACHGGPSAPKEIRVTHPERVNCLQCHVSNNLELVPIPAYSRKKEN
ncbi:hypothetical protein [Aureibacter tunicatorum]|uniref:Cytochrome c-type protein NapB n=1 Tax=Aureibacter tunicatorum TaxID=866807 RepID=A0AAE3XJA4_9BACT|nr:hypothetical protein [Aureibacter tunicatorum]MDR6237068.1 cytochrome c-type protein NapB [Aureibacter tunicatorum]BDD06060.1 hypothetical protein AUTU_35430 [Aureibacter tunicatorum]